VDWRARRENCPRVFGECSYSEIFAVQNASGHGLDVVAKLGDGRYAVFEVKTTAIGAPGTFSARQSNMTQFVRDVTSSATDPRNKFWKSADGETRQRARDLLNEMRNAPQNVSGNLIQVDLFNKTIDVSLRR
jgi:hypothetical protein